MQIKADVLQLPFQNLFRNDLSTLGSAVIAGYSVGLFNNIENTLKRFLKVKKEIKPTPGKDEKYIKYIKVYIGLLDMLKEVYKEISA